MQRTNTPCPWRYTQLSCLILLLLCGFGMNRAEAQVVSQTRFFAADGNQFGNTMVASGNTLVVGDSAWISYTSRIRQGAVYVFTLTNGQWTQTAELTASDGQAYDQFGGSVAIFNNTLVVGASNHKGVGAVYVFTPNAKGQWTQQQEIIPADGKAGDRFGTAVAVSKTAIAVSATIKGKGAGAAYTYTLNGGKWTQQAEIASPTGAGRAFFGAALALSATTLAVGAPAVNSAAGAVYTYAPDSTGLWAPQAVLTEPGAQTPGQFGSAVALSATTLAVGAPSNSAAYTFTLSGSVWSVQSALAPFEVPATAIAGFGHAIALVGSTLVISALSSDETATYVFAQSKRGWTQAQELIPYDEEGSYNQQFGAGVAIVGGIVVVSRPFASDGPPASTMPTGSVYTFVTGGAVTGQNQGQTGDGLGSAVAISGATLLAGVPGGEGGQGAVYAYTRKAGAKLAPQAVLTAADGQIGDGYGAALAFDGATLAVGAPNAGSGQGAVYIYTLQGGIWSLQAEFTASDGQPGDLFGYSAALFGSALAIGAPGRTNAAGATYVFTRNGSAWSQQAEIVAADGQSGDGFGWAVSLDGGNLVVGAPFATTAVTVAAGAAYVYTQSGSLWNPVAKLTARDGQTGDGFGASLAISGGEIAVDSPGDLDDGRVYLYAAGGGGWMPQAELTDAVPGNGFGTALALSGNTLVIGDVGRVSFMGQVCVYTLAAGSWSLSNVLSAALGQQFDYFGGAVAISGGSIAVGAPYANFGTGVLYAY